MKNRFAVLLAMMGVAWCCSHPASLLAQTNAAGENPSLPPDEKAACIQNLRIIYDAIQLYRADHKDIPNWLSDLVPQYIHDASVLICPVCKRTGQTDSYPVADPNMPCSYTYQFSPVPLTKSELPNSLTKTRRDWKRRQMGLVGSVVPIVRCRHHAVFLNLAFDGHIYESPPAWEVLMSNSVNVADLSPRRIFAADSTTNSTAAAAPGVPYPPRDPLAKSRLIDLSPYYNASLTESWLGNPNNDLSSLPAGGQNFAGVDYDVRGIIQLSSKAAASKRFPSRINGIKIRQKCARLHFLHSAALGSLAEEGKQLGSYIVHFGANHMQLEIPIIYGHDVRNSHALRGEKPSADLKIAWTGINGTNADARLFTTTWVNVAPAVDIESIDFVSAMETAAPFLVAITTE